MKGEANGQKPETFYYHYCEPCKLKLHVTANKCNKCGCPVKNTFYQSESPEDIIYNTPVNKIEKCMECVNVLQRGVICKKKLCFATGQGKCETCWEFDSAIFYCCQEVQREEGVLSPEKITLLRDCVKTLARKKE